MTVTTYNVVPYSFVVLGSTGVRCKNDNAGARQLMTILYWNSV